MTYISQSDIENVYGSANVAAWSDLTGGDTADSTRITASITYAEHYVENLFRASQYQVPFASGASGYDTQLVDWMSAIAGDWLYRSRGVRRRISRTAVDVGDGTGLTSETIARVRQEMGAALSGKIRLDAGLKSNPMAEGPSCVF